MGLKVWKSTQGTGESWRKVECAGGEELGERGGGWDAPRAARQLVSEDGYKGWQQKPQCDLPVFS